jgi:hypothetical protein
VPNEQHSQRPQLQCQICAGRLSLHASIILPAPRLHANPIRSSLRLCNQLVRAHAQPWKLTARQHEGTELCTRLFKFAPDQDRCMRKSRLVIHIPPMMRCEQTEVPCVAPHASANIGSKRDVSTVPQAPGPPQTNVEGSEAVPSLLAPVLCSRARRALPWHAPRAIHHCPSTHMIRRRRRRAPECGTTAATRRPTAPASFGSESPSSSRASSWRARTSARRLAASLLPLFTTYSYVN